MNPIPCVGDRVLILNVPDDGYKDLYEPYGVVDWGWTFAKVGEPAETESIKDKAKVVCFFTGYNPFYDGRQFSCSGGGHSARTQDFKFVKRAPAVFWKWKDVPRAGGGEDYEIECNWFELEYKDLR